MSDHVESATDRLGVLEAVGDEWRLRFVRLLPYPVERVWRAITEPAELAAWFPTTIDGELAAGASLIFRFRQDQAPQFGGTMLTFEPPNLLEFQWGPDRIRLELVAAGAVTRLTLFDILEVHGKAARDAAGWHVCLDSLELHLTPVPGRVATGWKDVHDDYVVRYGPEAATIGPPEGLA